MTWLSFKKIAAKGTMGFLVAFLALAPFSIELEPQHAKAQEGCVGYALGAIGISSLISRVALVVPTNDYPVTVATTGEFFKECILDPLLWAFVNTIIEATIDSITQWIQNGFEGGPVFVTDMNAYLLSIADRTAMEFFSGTAFGALCSPFQLEVKIATILDYFSPAEEDLECSLSDILMNAENFLTYTSGQFTMGGWTDWLSMTSNSNNNPYGAYLESQAELGVRLRNARGEQMTLWEWDDGYFSLKCDENNNADPNDDIRCTPGNFLQSQIEGWFEVPRGRLTIADEFNELLSALLQTLLTSATQSITGLLGLSDTPEYQRARASSALGSSVADRRNRLINAIDAEIAEAQAAGDTARVNRLTQLRAQAVAVDPDDSGALNELYRIDSQLQTIAGASAFGEGVGESGPGGDPSIPPPPGTSGAGGSNPPESNPNASSNTSGTFEDESGDSQADDTGNPSAPSSPTDNPEN